MSVYTSMNNGAAGSPLAIQTQTSIQPRTMYPSDFMRYAANWTDSTLTPSASRALTMSQQQGVGYRSPSVQYNTGLSLGQALANAMTYPSQLTMNQSFANANNLLTGQKARADESLGWGKLGAQQLSNQYALDQTSQNSLISLLSSLLGGYL